MIVLLSRACMLLGVVVLVASIYYHLNLLYIAGAVILLIAYLTRFVILPELNEKKE